MPLRVLDSNGSGDPVLVERAVEYAVRNGAKIINLSFAGETRHEGLGNALRRAYDKGVFIVAAAGNAPEGESAVDLDRNPLYPVCFDRVSSENFIYGVAATDETDRKAEFSNYGAGCIDISAPGTRAVSTQVYRPAAADFQARYGGFYNGTSISAPIVSGTVALLMALDSHLTPKQIMNILTDSAVRIDTKNPGLFGKLGRGRIDVASAVQLVVGAKKKEVTPETTASLTADSGRLFVVAPGAGRSPEVRLFTDQGIFVRGFDAYAPTFRGGASLAVADFDGNGKRTIITGAGLGGGPHVRIFDRNTRAIGGFFAYDPAFRGGVAVATGDLDGDRKDEIITGAGVGGGPHVRLFTPRGAILGGFFAFDKQYKGGVHVASGDLDGDGKAEIIVAGQPDGKALVRTFTANGLLLREFAPFGASTRRIARVTAEDLDKDGRMEVIVESNTGADAVVFHGDGTSFGTIIVETAKWNVGGDIVAPAQRPLYAVLGARSGNQSFVTSSMGSSLLRFFAYEPSFKGGVRVGVIQ
jgi:hypothetical protein